ncbi:ATP-binding cassette domain-containing protein [Streptomyces hirsutus]|uniref:branched-chain amino acid ABC transporter ATP-binding protein/permease n=1 Tax=Streptomyces hirsutus TaxID=35620 RepID=UPI0033C797D6
MAASVLGGSRVFVTWLVVTGLFLLGPSLGVVDATWTREIILICVLALLASSLNLSFGYAGELALGQVALYAAGAYLSGYFALHYTNELLIVLPLSIAAAVAMAAVASAVTVRLGGWALAVSTFFLVLVVPDIAGLFPEQLGGFEGLTGIPLPALAGQELGTAQFYLVAVLVTAVWLALFRNLVASRFGESFQVLRESRVLASSIGLSPYALKFHALLIAAVPAGLAGCLFAFLDGFVSPSSFNLHLTITILAASILGGTRSVYGALLGAVLIQVGPNQLTWFADYAYIAFGVFLIVGGLLFSNGLYGIARSALARLRRSDVSAKVEDDVEIPATTAVMPQMRGELLEVTDVAKSFGGNKALEGAGFVARPGEITALIGSNGSGKTTLFNVVSGFIRPDRGSVRLGGQELVGCSPHAIGRAGVARTFQTPLVPDDLSVEQTVQSAVFGQRRLSMFESMLRLPRHRSSRRHEAMAARAALTALGLDRLSDKKAGALPLGTRRLLELARAIAARPRVVLLDEVASGLDEHELEALEVLLRRLADAGATIVLVEHNFPLVRRIADRVVVLAQGRVVVDDVPATVASHPFVQQTYLAGSRHAEAQPHLALEEKP